MQGRGQDISNKCITGAGLCFKLIMSDTSYLNQDWPSPVQL